MIADTFLDTEKEQHAWHRGFWRGLKIQNPRRLRTYMYAPRTGFRIWEQQEGHYHDAALLLAYLLKILILLGLGYGKTRGLI